MEQSQDMDERNERSLLTTQRLESNSHSYMLFLCFPSIPALLTDDIPYRNMRKKMTRKLLLGNNAVYVAMMAIRMDMVVTRAAYRRPHDNLSNHTYT